MTLYDYHSLFYTFIKSTLSLSKEKRVERLEIFQGQKVGAHGWSVAASGAGGQRV